MRYDEILLEMEERKQMNSNHLEHLLDAVSQVYPLILLVNLTKDKYLVVEDSGLMFKGIESTGAYDNLIRRGKVHIHPNYQDIYMDAFDRSNLLDRFANKIRQVSVKVYHRNSQGDYWWINSKAIRLYDESGDVIMICLNEVIQE